MVKRYTVPEYSVLYCKDDGLLVEYKDYAALEARVADLEKDAARYRFIADQHSAAWEDDLDEQMSRES